MLSFMLNVHEGKIMKIIKSDLEHRINEILLDKLDPMELKICLDITCGEN